MRKSGVSLALLFSLFAPPKNLHAEAIMISGKLEAELPRINFAKDSGDLVAYVNSTTITASGDGTACNVTVDNRATSTLDNLVCFFEWLPNAYGMTANGFILSGIPNQVGEMKLPYLVSYYSGHERQKVEIIRSEYTVSTVAPVKPVITGMKSSINGQVLEGFIVDSYIKDEALRNITVQIQPRDFIQYISVGNGSSCEVPVGGDNCTITVGSVRVSDSDELHGSRNITVTANSKNNYFAPPETHNLTLRWDYRPPVVDHTLWNFTDDARTIDVGGQSIYTGPKTVAVAVKVPQQGTTGEWWLPTSMTLTLIPDGVFKPVTKVTLDDGTVLDFNQTWTTPTKRTLLPVTGPQLVGDEYLYIFDVQDLISGSYSASFAVENKSANKSVYDETNSKLMLSDSPSLLVIKDGQGLGKRAPVYFLDEVIVAAFQGQEGIADIKSATIDNKVVKLMPTSHKGIYYLPAGDDLALNVDHQLTLVAENIYGKQTTLETTFEYMPMGFTLKNLEKGTKLYSRVRQYTDLMSQTSGTNCTLFTTKENADEYLKWVGNNPNIIACYPQWNNVPDGLEFYFKGRTPGLSGFFNVTGENLLDYYVYMTNARGSRAVAVRNRFKLNAELPYDPVITYKKSKTIAGINPNTALVYTTGGEAARIVAKVVPSDINITTKQNGEEPVKTAYKNRSSSIDATSFVQRLKFGPSSLWTKNVMDIDVAYAKDPALHTQDILNVYTVPDFNIMTYLKVDDKKTATGLKLPLTINIGRYKNDCRCTKFVRSDMGEWDVTVYAQKSIYAIDHETGRYKTTYERTALTKPLPVNDEGIVTTKIDIKGLDLGNHRLIAVAQVRSPFEDFVMKRESSAVSIRVYNGKELEGGLSKGQIIGRIPLSTVVSFKTKSTADADALSPTEWQTSENNGTTWTKLTEMDGRRSVTIKKTTVGKWLYRAKMKNKFTNLESLTDVLTVVTYKEPKVSIKVVPTLEGNDIPVQLMDNGEPVPEGTAEVVWSEDKENWSEGSTSYNITASDELPQYIYARMRYSDSDGLTGEQAWKETSARVTITKPKRLSVKATGSSMVEVGQQVNLTGSYINPNEKVDDNEEVSEEWKTPDGQIIKGSALNLTLTEDMLDKQGYAAFEYSAWLTKHKEKTISTRRISVKSWVYKFPEVKMNTRLRYAMAPSTLTVSLSGVDDEYPGVTYTREWIYNKEELKLTKDDGDKKEFSILNSGKYTLFIVFKDNRGNESRLENTFIVDDQTPMKVEMTPKFSNKYMRAPLDVTLRSNIKLSHSADVVDTVTYKLNGQAIDGGRNYWTQFLPGLAEGKYQLVIEVVSKFGQRGTANVDFDVVKNAPPKCILDYTETNLSWNFTNKCTDFDGKMRKYEWYINDEQRNVFGNSATLSKNLNKGKQVVKVIAYDDSNDSDTQTVTVYDPNDSQIAPPTVAN
ncbi:hypothetical protein [Photorhabdus heterorhabditis]|uniref:hypothetical protein n=1 Tax=Photorhabdus heterorhabditis TaxID=880156 RepID=UPI001561E4C3|nr:hypothetical protein [Photorhabdus heterorhabditis]NRN29029.1 hypothetical protein [Photorhabdus heterorhabditis subsp. aluminescens]